MKKNIFKAFLFSVLSIVFSLSFISCSNDPDTPEDQTKNKLHEDPAKVEVELIECHMHGNWNTIETLGGPHQNPESNAKYLRRIQKVTYELVQGKGWQVAENSAKKFYVIQAAEYGTPDNQNPAPIYLMFIKYYNSKGVLMNQQFIDGGQDNIHQHFFAVENVKDLMTGNAKTSNTSTLDNIGYKYVDTTPWNKTVKNDGAKLTGSTNPLGFKGAVKFLQNRTTFDLRIQLYHGYRGKKDPKTQAFSPFNAPSAYQIQQGTWDINFTIPVVVYASREESLDELSETLDAKNKPESEYSESSKEFIHAIMKAFNITWPEAVEDYKTLYYTQGHVESGAIWL